MVQSMTGFGRGEAADERYKIGIEMKSVNHRYLDVNVRIPHKFSFYEAQIRQAVKKYAGRGKVDVFVSFELLGDEEADIRFNHSIAGAYIRGLHELSDEYDLDFRADAYRIATLPDVFELKDALIDEDEIAGLIDQAMAAAGEQFKNSRRAEGEHLAVDIRQKLNEIGELTNKIETRYPEILNEYRERIRVKAEELLNDRQIDERVLATELVVYADKLCVDEEMVRLRTHIDQLTKTLDMDEAVGRKLDFITQELNREANTILSKSTDITIADYGIELKTCIEKIREQIQNIE